MMPSATRAVPAGGHAGPVLRDIHMPPPPSWWPLAPGWWMLAGALLVLLAVLIWLAWRWQRRRRAWAAVAVELDALDARYRTDHATASLAAGLSQLLRRAVMRCGGDAHLQGAAWHAELGRLAPDLLSPTLIEGLAIAQYRPQATLDGDAAIDACRRWLRKTMRRAHA